MSWTRMRLYCELRCKEARPLIPLAIDMERPLLVSGRSFAKQHSAPFPDKWFSSRRLKKISSVRRVW